MVFGQSAQSNYIAAGSGGFDGPENRPYGSPSVSLESPTLVSSEKSALSKVLGVVSNASTNSIRYSFAGLLGDKSDPQSCAVEAMYGEGSGPNKRPHVDNPQTTSQQTVRQDGDEERIKKKGQKKVGKKAEPQPLVGLFNDVLGKYDSPVSVRRVLQDNKVDITWMYLLAWSPAVCREIKRLCTRVAKKRVPRVRATAAPQQFSFVPPQQYPQPMPPQFAQPSTTGGGQSTPQIFQQSQPPQVSAAPLSSTPGASLNSRSDPIVLSTAIEDQDGERHTRFLSAMIGLDKAFRIPCSVIKPNGETLELDQRYTQANQGSDMNVISTGLAQHLGLDLHDLSEVGFKGLSMRTADSQETVLHQWVWLRIVVEQIIRDIRCFVTPEIHHTTAAGKTEHLSLILGLPWLYSVDAFISIRKSKIMIGDTSVGETVRQVVGPELVFCKDHNLLMYPKSIMAASGLDKIDDIDGDSSDSSDSEDDISDIDDPVPSFQ